MENNRINTLIGSGPDSLEEALQYGEDSLKKEISKRINERQFPNESSLICITALFMKKHRLQVGDLFYYNKNKFIATNFEIFMAPSLKVNVYNLHQHNKDHAIEFVMDVSTLIVTGKHTEHGNVAGARFDLIGWVTRSGVPCED